MTNESRKLSRRQVMGAIGAFGLSAALAPVLARAEERKHNVLFVAVDDLNTHLGCYGHDLVKSPNIDRLAARGIRFDHAYCQYPICNPTRSSVFTGMRPDTTGVYDNYTHFRDKLPKAVTLPHLFRDNGYTVLHYGKIFHGKYGDPDAWSKWSPKNPFRPTAKRVEHDGADIKGLTDPKEIKKRKAEWMYSWKASKNPDELHPDGRYARSAVRAMEELKDRPFFMAVGFAKPHVPLVAPKKYFDMYPPKDMPLVTGPEDDLDDVPKVACNRNFRTYFRHYLHHKMTDDEAREVVAAFYACTTFMDAQFGLILDALDRLNLADNTLVIFWGDHGWHLGEHWIWAKRTLFEESCRVPLILAGPGVAHPGTPSEAVVECVDLYPTAVEVCNLPKPEGLEGVSLLPLMKDPTRSWKKCAFTQMKRGDVMGVSIRTERYRYTEWGGPDQAELYDHQTDPQEYRNLAKRPEYSAKVKELHALMRAGWRSAQP
ncbi:MAG: sulfatase [Planctomycetes bacterium]|nr:sulfatase [Planctomycetota bacterium]